MQNYSLNKEKVTTFYDVILPEPCYLVGYTVLIKFIEDISGQQVVLPETIAVSTDKNRYYTKGNVTVFTIKHHPKNNLFSHLQFAMRYEAVDIYILKRFFELYEKKQLEKDIYKEPTGKYNRKIWFLYEWLMNDLLDLPDLNQANYVDLLDSKIQFSVEATKSSRHRINNNLPGNRNFCPLVRRTDRLENFINMDLTSSISKGLESIEKNIIKRSAAFLLLKDSKASFAIEGENPPSIRARNWGKIIGQAGNKELSISEIERLQKIVIGSKKLKDMGLRKGEGFIGIHDRDSFEPLPDHISARAKDVNSLLDGLFHTQQKLSKSYYNAVLSAATIAFGFVFIHPLADGNGRIHRYLIHHILAEKGFTNKDMIFPVSASILKKIVEYQEILEKFSQPRLDLIDWKQDENHNVSIINHTKDLYRYFDATIYAEFLFSCVEDTIVNIIPKEIEYLEKYDKLTTYINSIVSLPNTKVDLLIKYLFQNKNKLSKNKRKKEFEELNDIDVNKIEEYLVDL